MKIKICVHQISFSLQTIFFAHLLVDKVLKIQLTYHAEKTLRVTQAIKYN